MSRLKKRGQNTSL